MPDLFEDAEEWGYGSIGVPDYKPSDQHLKWLQQTTSEMADEYDRVFNRLSTSRGRIQESGHEIEAGWREFLTNWLPPQYEVKTRKYIVGEIDSGDNLEETDLVVLRPNYPKFLREKPRILASGVAAAFSVKSTLRKRSIYEAAESGARLQRSLAPREGTPRSELTRPFPFGILAHSHEWKRDNSDPLYNVSKHLFEADQMHAKNPRDSVDLVCVTDLASWNNIKSVEQPLHLSEDLLSGMSDEEAHQARRKWGRIRVRSLFVLNPPDRRGAVLASFLTALYSRLAVHDKEFKALADSFSHMGADSGGRNKSRLWDPELVLSESVRNIPQDGWKPFSFSSEFSTTYGWHVPWPFDS